MAVIHAEVPVRSRREAVAGCRRVSLSAEYKGAEIAVDDVFAVGASGLARRSSKRRIRQLGLQRCLDRIGNGQRGPIAAEDALGAGADEVGGLIPSERQIGPPEFRRVQSITLIIDADAAAPEVVGIAAVGGAALQINPVEERAGGDRAVFLEFGAALSGYRREPVVRRPRPADPARRLVAEEATARLQTRLEIPTRPITQR